jgi:hypothetical protein
MKKCEDYKGCGKILCASKRARDGKHSGRHWGGAGKGGGDA